MLATPPRAHPELALSKNVEALLGIEMGAVILMAFACVLGVHVALRNVNSQSAIVNTLATIFFLSAGTGFCIKLILINSRFESQWFSFIFFLAAGIGGLVWGLRADRRSPGFTDGQWLCTPPGFHLL